MALLHRVKERKTPSLSAHASFAPFSLKVAWSGKSLIIELDVVGQCGRAFREEREEEEAGAVDASNQALTGPNLIV